MCTGPVKTTCPNKFHFNLKCKNRVYELYAPSKTELQLWTTHFGKLLGVPVLTENSDYDDLSDDNDLAVRYLKM